MSLPNSPVLLPVSPTVASPAIRPSPAPVPTSPKVGNRFYQLHGNRLLPSTSSISLLSLSPSKRGEAGSPQLIPKSPSFDRRDGRDSSYRDLRDVRESRESRELQGCDSPYLNPIDSPLEPMTPMVLDESTRELASPRSRQTSRTH
uniref:ARAD1A05258p n=1 Tax=Blastobotrys adeninivorans TaxID=409370 RepID=A0A060T303_BLAAD